MLSEFLESSVWISGQIIICMQKLSNAFKHLARVGSIGLSKAAIKDEDQIKL